MKRINEMSQGKAFAVLSYLAVFFVVGGFLLRTLRFLWPLHAWPFWLVYTVLCAALLLGFVLPRGRVTKWVGALGDTGMCVQFLLLFPAIPLGCVDVLLVRWLGVIDVAVIAPIMVAGLALGCGLVLYGLIHAHHIHIRQVAHVVSPRGERSLRVVHLSDLHLGFINDLPRLQHAIELVNAEKPDIVCITGDTFTENMRNVYDEEGLIEAFRGINSRLGVFGCLGNHDSGQDFGRMMTFFEKAGIRILVDEVAVVEDDVILAGRADASPGGRPNHTRPSIAALLAAAPKGHPCILMDHQPGDIEAAQTAGVDLLLCGHTHGGQFFPVQLLTRMAFPRQYRCIKRFGGMLSSVSSGTMAALPPMRIGSDAEIITITLRY